MNGAPVLWFLPYFREIYRNVAKSRFRGVSAFYIEKPVICNLYRFFHIVSLYSVAWWLYYIIALRRCQVYDQIVRYIIFTFVTLSRNIFLKRCIIIM